MHTNISVLNNQLIDDCVDSKCISPQPLKEKKLNFFNFSKCIECGCEADCGCEKYEPVLRRMKDY